MALLFKISIMANAEKTAPLKKEPVFAEFIGEKVKEGTNEYLYLDSAEKYDIGKKYMFQLAEESVDRDYPVMGIIGSRSNPEPKKKFKPYHNIVFTSQIVWNGSRRMIRYYDGCDTIFADKQPKDKETIDQYIKQTKRRNFTDGKFGVFGDEKMLLLYLNICSWNGESPFKTRTSDTVFVSVNPDKQASIEMSKLDEAETALKYAKEATETKMRIHADYLGIPTVDYDSGNELSEKEIRIEYRKEALKNAHNFITTYGNKSIEIKYFIDKALEKGIINNKFNPNKATWGSNNSVICDISGMKSTESIAQKLFEFSQTEEGAEFVIQLKAINE